MATRSSRSEPRGGVARWSIVVGLLAMTLLSAACVGLESSGEPPSMPPELLLRSWISGGIAGRADELTVDRELVALLTVRGRPVVRLPLEGADRERLQALVSRGAPFATEDRVPAGVADGMAGGVTFAGQGDEDVRPDVAALAGELLARLSTVAGVVARPLVVVGEVVDGRLIVERVLRSDGDVSGGSRLEFSTGPPRAAPGRRVWGLALGDAGKILIWHQAPSALESTIVELLESPRA